jgi:hypothetical protein
MHNAEANFLYNLTGEGAADDKVSNFEIGRNQQQLAAKMAKRNAMIAALERSGVDHGHGSSLRGAVPILACKRTQP